MIYDISQELTNCAVFPGNTKPLRTQVKKMDEGERNNLSDLVMCVHNGTHLDSPYHFINEGKAIDQIPLEQVVGVCYVYEHTGELTKEDAMKVMAIAKANKADKRILLKGELVVTIEAAKVFANSNIYLLGNESQTVGPMSGAMAVHIELLRKNIVLLEGIRLSEVPEGVYFLSAAPINIKGSDGAPVRAYLIKE